MSAVSDSLPLGEMLRQAAERQPQVYFARRAEDAPGDYRLDCAALDLRAELYRECWLSTGLAQRTAVGIIATPEPDFVAAIVGAARAGMQSALYSPGLEASAIAAAAGVAKAAAVAGPSYFASLDFGERLAEARAVAPSVTWVMLWDAEGPKLSKLDNIASAHRAAPRSGPEGGIAVLRGARVFNVDVRELNAIASDFVKIIGLTSGSTLVSLASPATSAGLVSAIHAPLIAGANVIWQAPFSAATLTAVLEDCVPTHLVAPIAIVEHIGAVGLLRDDQLASLTVIQSSAEGAPFFDIDIDLRKVIFLDADLAGPAPLRRAEYDYPDWDAQAGPG